MPLFIFRSNDYTEFKTVLNCTYTLLYYDNFFLLTYFIVLLCNTSISAICHDDNGIIYFRSNNYTEFNTCTRCNPVVADTYDSLETTNIGMCVIG